MSITRPQMAKIDTTAELWGKSFGRSIGYIVTAAMFSSWGWVAIWALIGWEVFWLLVILTVRAWSHE